MYNPNVNLFSYCVILFEFLPSGNLIKSAKFYPINLFEFNSGLYIFKTIFYIFYILFISYEMIHQFYEFFKLRRSYFKQFWAYVECLIIIFSWVGFSMYFYKFYETSKILDQLKDSKNEKPYVNLQYLSYCSESLSLCLGFCAAFGTLKLFKILKISKRISLLGLTLKDCLEDIISFSVLFLLIWFPFVHLMHFIYFDKIAGFSTFLKAMMTGVEIILGKFESASIIR